MTDAILSEIENNTTRCYYSEDRNLISIPAVNSFTSEEEYFSSLPTGQAGLFHELVHWTGHKSRLNAALPGG
ncbi:MAG: zincin-like metallopeptidase domain-containing protein [Ignavibacteriaceae bacterium]